MYDILKTRDNLLIQRINNYELNAFCNMCIKGQGQKAPQ